MVNNIAAIHVPVSKKRSGRKESKLPVATVAGIIESECELCSIEIINDPKIVEKRRRELITDYENDLRAMKEQNLLIQI